MDNDFIARYADWQPTLSRNARMLNRLLQMLRMSPRVVDPRGDGRMCGVEQRMNLFHLVEQVLAYDVPGDVVDVGSYTGSAALVIGKVLAGHGSGREFHSYDAWLNPQLMSALKKNFSRAGVPAPELHRGWVQDTIPEQLPDQICFAHVDLGSRISPELEPLKM